MRNKIATTIRGPLAGLVMKMLRLLPPRARQKLTGVLGYWAQRLQAPKLAEFRPAASHPEKSAPIVIVGVFQSASGLGVATRSTYYAMIAAGLEPIAVDVTQHFAPVDFQLNFPLQEFDSSLEGTILFHVNAPEIRSILRMLNYLDGRSWRVIGYWAWELPVFPRGWDVAFRYVNEIWTLSEYAADVFRSHPEAPLVRHFPIPVTPPRHMELDRRPMKLGETPFTVLVMADPRSSFGRKNVFGSIAAFREAFSSREDVRLVIKTRNLSSDPYIKSKLVAEIGSSSNIQMLDGCMSSDEYWQTIDSADVLMSLHRAEGFGLPMAEAMSLGKLVIATGWSGNLSFMHPGNSLLVEYQLKPVKDDFALYEGYGGHWADAVIGHASKLLLATFENPSQFDHLREEAKKTIAIRLNVDNIGASMRAALLEND